VRTEIRCLGVHQARCASRLRIRRLNVIHRPKTNPAFFAQGDRVNQASFSSRTNRGGAGKILRGKGEEGAPAVAFSPDVMASSAFGPAPMRPGLTSSSPPATATTTATATSAPAATMTSSPAVTAISSPAATMTSSPVATATSSPAGPIIC
jgi:hypothetical protein